MDFSNIFEVPIAYTMYMIHKMVDAIPDSDIISCESKSACVQRDMLKLMLRQPECELALSFSLISYSQRPARLTGLIILMSILSAFDQWSQQAKSFYSTCLLDFSLSLTKIEKPTSVHAYQLYLKDTCSQKGIRTHRAFGLWHKEIMGILEEAKGHSHQEIPFIFNASFLAGELKDEVYHTRDTMCQIWLSFWGKGD